MKTITKEFEKTIKEVKTIFVAEDGTEFLSKEECSKYEMSAIYALKKRLGDILVPLKRIEAIDVLLDDWRGEADYYSVKFKDEQQIRDFIAYLKASGVYVTANHDDKDEDVINRYKKTHYISYEELEVGVQYIILGRDDWQAITSKERLLQTIESAWKEMLA